MKALLLSDGVRVADLPAPMPRANELLIRVRYCGLCGSDFHLAAGTYPGLVRPPVVLGHEFSGTVVAYGEGTSRAIFDAFPLGTPVTAEEMLWCGRCAPCAAGHLNHCENLEELGFTVDGAHAEFVRVPAKYCWSLAELPETDAFLLGALVEPYAVAYRALLQGAHAGGWRKGTRVLTLGAGPIGLAVADLARLEGAGEVTCLDREPARSALAARLGAGTEARGKYDWIVDAAGAPRDLFALAEKHLAIGGSICLLARTLEPAIFSPELLITRNARVFGSQGHAGDGTFGRVIERLPRLRALDLVEEIIPVDEAAARLASGKKAGGKILVQPT